MELFSLTDRTALVTGASSGLGRHFGPSGGLLGPFWGRCWAHFGVLFLSEAGKAYFLETMLPPAWEHHFQGSEGSKIIQKAIQNVTENSFRRQVRLERLSGTIWEHFWLHFGPRGGLQEVPRRPQGAAK